MANYPNRCMFDDITDFVKNITQPFAKMKCVPWTLYQDSFLYNTYWALLMGVCPFLKALAAIIPQ